ncbi:MAG TPA: c-type cytochrome [Polyangiaceae bacterium]|nr:c-type cytochrome [Polyangiaceae bacterium]
MNVWRRCLVALLLAGIGACEREDRPFSDLSPLRDGERRDPSHFAQATGASHTPRNAFSVSEGQRLFDWFNCSGCHGGGGGGHIGPPLTDAAWRYGSSIEDVYRSIADGRPNGMPAFRGLIVDQQIWQLSAYVLGLSGRVPQGVNVSRPDGIGVGEPPVMRSEQTPHREQVNL